jgi:hypothetical protein
MRRPVPLREPGMPLLPELENILIATHGYKHVVPSGTTTPGAGTKLCGLRCRMLVIMHPRRDNHHSCV